MGLTLRKSRRKGKTAVESRIGKPLLAEQAHGPVFARHGHRTERQRAGKDAGVCPLSKDAKGLRQLNPPPASPVTTTAGQEHGRPLDKPASGPASALHAFAGVKR